MSSEDPGNQADQPTDEQMTAEEYRQVARALAREERWEDLAALYIERAEGSPNAAGRARYLVHAAQVFDRHLGDADRAYITYFAAFQDDPSNQDAVAELARVTTSLGRFPELLEECMTVAEQLTPPDKQAAMYVAMSTWFQEQLGDSTSSEQALEAALAADLVVRGHRRLGLRCDRLGRSDRRAGRTGDRRGGRRPVRRRRDRRQHG